MGFQASPSTPGRYKEAKTGPGSLDTMLFPETAHFVMNFLLSR